MSSASRAHLLDLDFGSTTSHALLASACRLARPHGVWVDPDGTLFIGDSENHRVRAIRKR